MNDFNAYKGAGRDKARDLRFKEQDGKCYYCGIQCRTLGIARNVQERNTWFVLDHKVSRAEGGSDMFSNLIGSCWLCNELKGKKSIHILDSLAPAHLF